MFGQDEEQPQQQLDGNPPEEKGDDEVKSLRDEVKNLRGRVSEAENNTRFWYEKANGGEGRQAAEADADDDPAPQLDEDLVDVLSSGDTKKVKETFRKLGFV